MWRPSVLPANAARREAPRCVDLVPIPPLIEPSTAIAVELQEPVYDCNFLALAEQTTFTLLPAPAGRARGGVA